ncbi:hypothetical protein AVEN_273007-1 [Araneus ventricosus]|uniref:Uncharacterized protein n=1 Tax=Araneus ventricosus TaxID=182803 RepID=A0A4Y2EXD4_ARAVE|nr:hypothetical protein AVEN_273007-1 [Araneus ventricosus]
MRMRNSNGCVGFRRSSRSSSSAAKICRQAFGFEHPPPLPVLNGVPFILKTHLSDLVRVDADKRKVSGTNMRCSEYIPGPLALRVSSYKFIIGLCAQSRALMSLLKSALGLCCGGAPGEGECSCRP